jgi:hypothetical protein
MPVTFIVLRSQTGSKTRELLAAALFVSGAVLTKSIAGLIPGIGVLLYLLVVSRWRRVFKARYLMAGAVGLLPVAAYYLWRERIDPGYLSLVGQNDLLGRYTRTIGMHDGPFYAYLVYLMPPSFVGGALIPLLPFGWWFAKGRARLGLIYATVVAAAIVIVYSAAATKLSWYIIPALPWIAVAVTLAARAVLPPIDSMSSRWGRMARWGILLLVAASMVSGITYRHWYFPTKSLSHDMYGSLLEQLHDRGERTVHILDGGVENTEGLVQYTPQLRFYTLYWGRYGMTIRSLASADDARPGDLIATCDPHKITTIASIAGAVPIIQENNCLAVNVTPYVEENRG